LVAAGVLRRAKDGVRILGNGELTTKLTITANHATGSAKAAVEKAGGSLKIIVPKVLEADVTKRAKTAAKKAKAARKAAGGKAE
jgi:large subunit ribosomal protein L15